MLPGISCRLLIFLIVRYVILLSFSFSFFSCLRFSRIDLGIGSEQKVFFFFFYDFNVVTLPNTIIIVIVAIIIRIVIMIMIIGLSKICNHHFDNKIIDRRDIVPHRTHVTPSVRARESTIYNLLNRHVRGPLFALLRYNNLYFFLPFIYLFFFLFFFFFPFFLFLFPQ